MSGNEKFVLSIVLIGSLLSLAIFFLPENKAINYLSIPTALITGAFGYLGLSKNDNK